MSQPVVALAFSGGLDTSWCVPWLREQGYEVITVTVDVGGMNDRDRRDLAARSEELGAVEHVLVEAREAFFDQILKYLVMGNVLRGELYPLCVGAERSLQAAEVARVALARGAAAICHGCTGAGNDQVRFEVALRAVAPDITVLAPIRDLGKSRAEEAEELRAHGIDVDPSTATYSVNSGLWGTTIGGQETLGTSESIPESAWVRTQGAFDDPPPPRSLTVDFEKGIPVAIDGDAMAPVPLIERLDAIAALFGIGRGIHLGETVLGIKGRVAFEAPAATALITAHRELEKLVLTGRQIKLKAGLARDYGEWVHQGLFYEPACRDVEALLRSSQARVTGRVHLELRFGHVFVTGVTSKHSLRDASKAAYGETAGEWTPADAAGFSTIFAMPVLLHSRAGDDS